MIAKQSRTTKIALYYTLSELFYSVLWTTRLSILFSIVRIAPSRIMRRMLYGLAGLFFVCWGILFAQDFWVCEGEPSWKELPAPQCTLGTQVAIAQLITDVFADAALIAFPMKLLWNLRVSKGHRVRLLLTFSTSVITTIVSLVHAYYVLRVGGLEELIAAIVENSISLIVCNTAVIVTAIMRIVGMGGEDDSPGRKEMYVSTNGYNAPSASAALKTINLSSTSSIGGTKVEYGDTAKFGTIGRKSPSLWGGPDAGIHVQKEQLQVVSFPSSKGV
ncbi:hypothetical protein HGRIS_011567 [Hohenbuehelia grisea]|uniref:Rhodopsin domain-containing protein n=1 Tax=Hohenbuehelia grisea TaxID=104357 RepID=A0ABR3JVG9_9AGAR